MDVCINNPDQLEEIKSKILEERYSGKTCITVCCGTGCSASGAEDVVAAFNKELKKRDLNVKVLTRSTGCQGFCEQGPIVVIFPDKIFYRKVSVKDVPEIVLETVVNGEIIKNLLYIDPVSGNKIKSVDDIPFYKKQSRQLMADIPFIDPLDIFEYIAFNGYIALSKVLSMEPDEIIEEIKKSGLRGRGGAGFSTARKWESCKKADGEQKYVICNADEGDPGAFMDRSLLEGNPHSVLEGMIIGAYAVGSHYGYIYV